MAVHSQLEHSVGDAIALAPDHSVVAYSQTGSDSSRVIDAVSGYLKWQKKAEATEVEKSLLALFPFVEFGSCSGGVWSLVLPRSGFARIPFVYSLYPDWGGIRQDGLATLLGKAVVFLWLTTIFVDPIR